MGAEAMILIAGLNVGQKIMAAEEQAKATAKQGKIQAEQRKIQTMARAGRQKASFLASGVTLAGTPLAVLEDTYTTGEQDIRQIISNANQRSKNIMNQAFSDVLQQSAMAVAGAGMGGGGSPIAAQPTGMAMLTDPSQQLWTPGTKPSRGGLF